METIIAVFFLLLVAPLIVPRAHLGKPVVATAILSLVVGLLIQLDFHRAEQSGAPTNGWGMLFGFFITVPLWLGLMLRGIVNLFSSPEGADSNK